MMMNYYVNNKTELNQKVQEYGMQGYDVKFLGNNNVVVKKKNYSLALLIVLLLFGFIIVGVIYYLLADETTIDIQIDPRRCNHPAPQSMSYSEPSVNNAPVDVPDNSGISGSSIFCPGCGTKLSKTEKFCPKCGKKVN